jgi:hypothetical protein
MDPHIRKEVSLDARGKHSKKRNVAKNGEKLCFCSAKRRREIGWVIR